ncbi:MAG: ACT domain-containing protein, partial [Thermoplasmata archaeon]
MSLREISLTLPNRPGALVGVARILAKERINLAAISADSTPARGRVRLIVNDPERAESLLARAGYEVEAREMIAVHLEDHAGSFLKVLEVLAREKVNVQSVAILITRERGQVVVALSATDLPRA